MPSTPRAVEMGAPAGSTFRTPEPSDSAHSRQPTAGSPHPPSAGRGHPPPPPREGGVAGALDPADRPSGHRLAEGERGDVRADVVHPRPPVGIDGEEGVPDQQLSPAGVRGGRTP